MTDKQIREKLRVQIEEFNRTGKLPKEYDVREAKRAGTNFVNYENIMEKIAPLDSQVFKDNYSEFINELSATQLKCYQLHIVGGLSRQDVADMLGVKGSVVARSIWQIRKKLKQLLNKH